jgi:hypothetical protein
MDDSNAMTIPGGRIMLRTIAALLLALVLCSDAQAFGRYSVGRYGSFGNYQPGRAGRAASTHFPRTSYRTPSGRSFRFSHPRIPRIYNVGNRGAVFRGGFRRR